MTLNAQLKITQMMLAKGFGGAERSFVDLAISLAELGHDVQTICHKKFQALDELTACRKLKVETFSPHGWWDILARRKIHAAVKQFNPDIMHAHLARAAYAGGKICVSMNIPFVVKTHNYVDLKYYRHVNCFITTTMDQKNYLASHGVDQAKIKIIPNFSSIAPVESVSVNNNTELNITSYGRLVKKKGFHVLLRSFKRFLDTGHKARLKIGGDGPERDSLLKLSRELEIGNEIEFSGWINDVVSFMKSADIFVLPSLDEPFGIAILEAMALGKPIVATKTQGPSEILNNDTALLVQPDDIDGLANALHKFAEHAEERQQKAEEALALYRHKFYKPVVVTQITELYKHLAGSDQSN